MKKALYAGVLSVVLAATGVSEVQAGGTAAPSGGGDDAVAIVVILGILGMAIWGGTGSRSRTKERVTTTPKGPSNGTWKF